MICSTHFTGGVFDAPSQRLESAPMEAPDLGRGFELAVPTESPLMLAQATTTESAETAAEGVMEEIERS